MNNFRIVLSEEQIQSRVEELGKKITSDYQGKSIVVICMLKGAIVFFSDIVRNLNLPLSMEFARLSSYKNGTSSGEMEVVHDISSDITGKDVLIIEDIVDSGKTLSYFVKLLNEKNPASIKICAFLDKKERRQKEIDLDYVGFEIENKFVVGYGLDYDEKLRNLPYIGYIEE